MKNTTIRFGFLILFVFQLASCARKTESDFPFSESDMVNNKLYGALLEYAIYDSTKVDFVEKYICENIKKNQELSFKKMETIIVDSTYYFFGCQERECFNSDYIGVVYFDVNNIDSVYYYSKGFRYDVKDIDFVFDEIVRHNKSTIEETLKYSQVGNLYIPRIYFVVDFHTMNCTHGFIKKVIYYNQLISHLVESYADKNLVDRKIEINLNIEIKVRFTD